MILATQRLALRPIADSDTDDYFAMQSSEDFMQFWSEPAWTDRAQAENRVRRLIEGNRTGDSTTWSVFESNTGDFAGFVCLFNYNEQCRRAEIGYGVTPGHWGKSYGPEAVSSALSFGFSDRQLLRVEADIDPENVASARLLEKLGFQLEGILRERWIVAGKVSYTALYGLLSRDWRPFTP